MVNETSMKGINSCFLKMHAKIKEVGAMVECDVKYLKIINS